MSKIVCDECHKAVDKVLELRLGKSVEHLGVLNARKQERNPDYYDGFVDGITEARAALESEVGLYWDKLRS